MEDIYLYKNTSVLKNKLDIKDKNQLEDFESFITYTKFLNVDEVMQNREFNFDYIKDVHKHIFGYIYEWAGEPRKINIEKSEKVLNGMSVEYCDYTQVEKEANRAITEMKNTRWDKLSLNERAELFSKQISDLWKVHAFREGNTRTIMTFSERFAESHGFHMDGEIFKTHATYVRDSLVLASIGEYSEYEHLTKIIKDSMEIGERKFLRDNTYVKFNSSFNEINKNDVYKFKDAEELISVLSEKYSCIEEIKLSVCLDKACKKELFNGYVDLKSCEKKLSYVIKKDKYRVKREELER